MIKTILVFLLGTLIGMVLTSCLVISKESEKVEKDIRKTKND